MKRKKLIKMMKAQEKRYEKYLKLRNGRRKLAAFGETTAS